MIDNNEIEARENLVRKLKTPPPDPESFEAMPPNSYQRFNELAEEIDVERVETLERQAEQGKAFWEATGKK